MVKLRFEKERPRASGYGNILVNEEVDLEVHASEGLEIFRFQASSWQALRPKMMRQLSVSLLPLPAVL